MDTQNIPLFKVFMAPTAAEEVGKVLNCGFIGQGQKVEEFELNLKNYLNCSNVVTTNTGTSALHLAIHMLKNPVVFQDDNYWPGIDENDEILTTSLTCTASNFPILANNIKLKWVDIDPTTLNMDLDDLERKISPKTKAIIVVHWGGYPNDLNRLKNIQDNCKKLYGYAPIIIEDCAHAFGSKYEGKFLGNHGNMVMYSFQAIKHITTVDGGLLVLPSNQSEERAKLLRWYGIDRNDNRKDFRCETDIKEWGFKFHMNDVCATVGIENLKHADEILSTHKDNAKFYDNQLKNISGVNLLTRHPERESSFWIYSMLVENKDGFIQHMKECGISVSQVHERNDKHTCVKKYKSFLPQLDKTISKVISIPVGWWVNQEQREYIVDCIKRGW